MIDYTRITDSGFRADKDGKNFRKASTSFMLLTTLNAKGEKKEPIPPFQLEHKYALNINFAQLGFLNL